MVLKVMNLRFLNLLLFSCSFKYFGIQFFLKIRCHVLLMEFSRFSSLAALTKTVVIMVEKLNHKNWSRVRDESDKAAAI